MTFTVFPSQLQLHLFLFSLSLSQVPLVVAEAVGDKEDGAPLSLLSVRRLLVLLAGQRQHERRGVQVLHQLRLLLDSLQEHQDEKCGDGVD